MLIDNKDFAESTSELTFLMLQEMGIEITDEVKEMVQAESEPLRVKLNENGY